MSNGNGNGNSSVGIVAIIAILVLIGMAAWFMFGKSGRKPSAPQQTTTQPNSDVQIKVDLPDSISIKP